MSHALHKKWLKVNAVLSGCFGPIFFLGSMLRTSEPARFSLDLMSWPLDGKQTFAEPTTRFLSALTGGFLMGWGVMIWMLTDVYDHAPEQTRRAVVAGDIVWFVVDSTGSVLSGNASNVIVNLVSLIMVIGPLWRPARDESAAAPLVGKHEIPIATVI